MRPIIATLRDQGSHTPATRAEDPRNAWCHTALLIGSVAVLMAAALLRVPNHQGVEVARLAWELPELCMFRRTTGQPCPGCGLTRSLVSAVHGDVPAAFQFNAAGPLLLALMAFQVPYRSWQLWRYRTARRPSRLPGGIVYLGLIVAVLLVQFAARLAGLC